MADIHNDDARGVGFPSAAQEPHMLRTGEGAAAFQVEDALVRLVFNYGSFLPGSETFYGTQEAALAGFLDAVRAVGIASPERALQYAAWQRDPRRGKGNRSQSPWVLAALATLPGCLAHPRFAELVARCIVRPDDALLIVRAASVLLGGQAFPPQLRRGIAQGLDAASDYQLAKYCHASLDLLPERRESAGRGRVLLPEQGEQQWDGDGGEEVTSALVPTVPARTGGEGKALGKRTLRLVDVLGICRGDLSPRLLGLYGYLKSPTRLRKKSGPRRLIAHHFPLLLEQKALRESPPRTVGEVEGWVERALRARMTIEQIFSSTGLAPGDRKRLLALTAPASPSASQEATGPAQAQADGALLSRLQMAEVARLEIRAALWRALLGARVEGEDDSQRAVEFLGDVAFLRNVRGMIESGVPVADLLAEASRRRFAGIWPFQLLGAARALRAERRRGGASWRPCPQALPVLDAIFEQVAVAALPRKEDGSLFSMLGLADVSDSMRDATLGGKNSSATCMDAALAWGCAFSLSTRGERFGGLAGSWASTFCPAVADVSDGPLAVVEKVLASGGWGGFGTQVFGSFISLISWLVEHPQVPRPEVVIVLSDMQFEPPETIPAQQLRHLPEAYREVLNRPEMRDVPPLAAAIVLYREVLGSEVSLVLWNLAAYEGSPVPSGMDRVLLLSGFDANSLRSLELWLRAGSPGSAMPVSPETAPAGDGQSGSSIEAVLYALRQY